MKMVAHKLDCMCVFETKDALKDSGGGGGGWPN